MNNKNTSRRDFLITTTNAFGIVGVACFAWPFIDQMNPAADMLALAKVDCDLSKITAGQSATLIWRGKPIFVRHRTAQEIEKANLVKLADLPDPEDDSSRAQRPEYLIVVGICTHLGCVPLGQNPNEPKGEYEGWFCPCHGSQYDTSGRIRKGPAPTNLPVPKYRYVSDTVVRIG
ncbi:ubiquinol-cytochrome c reductase, iron-sulfur subunit [Candidatus Endolissoclinum faulkneri L5]|uniref:Ubiquinol-cytochrome c reductase iron-sulfur subunit n=1 Tax=Candidatus Endolissoclinum faulkneri L5 TaxID=1401328 RepID=V9TW96_9PROT|nr:ubiquinol-cytochrome c reductase iron-sulfur subunit [Candidatus Endolissoclinum faulkneri]AHC73600.1 ubiquinol-cytochrome c reductase, iron-sulfur subunit [Candidatus Endolissoclinum faulkneri L5]